MSPVANRTGCRCLLLFDILLGILLILVSIFLEIETKPKRIGFFCNDESLQYPYQQSTVGGILLITISLLIPLVLIIIVELARCFLKKIHLTLTSRLCIFLRKFGKHCGFYIIGLCLTFNTAEVAKVTIGRLRPHFLDVCQPQLPDGRNCSDPTVQGHYIEDYECIAKGFTAQNVRQIHYSFPSHHSAICFYAMFYIALYLQKNFKWSGSRLTRPIVQFCLLMLAWYTSLARIADHWHHGSDVVAGIAIGVITVGMKMAPSLINDTNFSAHLLVALIHAFFIARLFEENSIKSKVKRPQQQEDKEELQQTEDCVDQEGNKALPL